MTAQSANTRVSTEPAEIAPAPGKHPKSLGQTPVLIVLRYEDCLGEGLRLHRVLMARLLGHIIHQQNRKASAYSGTIAYLCAAPRESLYK